MVKEARSGSDISYSTFIIILVVDMINNKWMDSRTLFEKSCSESIRSYVCYKSRNQASVWRYGCRAARMALMASWLRKAAMCMKERANHVESE